MQDSGVSLVSGATGVGAASSLAPKGPAKAIACYPVPQRFCDFARLQLLNEPGVREAREVRVLACIG